MYVITKTNNRRIEIHPATGGSYGAFWQDTGERAYPGRLPLRLNNADAIRKLQGFARVKGWQVVKY